MNESDAVNVDKKKLMFFFKKYQKDAEHVVNDKEKIKDIIKKSKSIIHKLEKAPFIGAVIGDYIDMIDMLIAYVKGEYKKLPIPTLISIVAMLLYTLSPIDLVPDAIPVIGFADDAALIEIVSRMLIGQDLAKFRKFRLNKELVILQEWIEKFLGKGSFEDRFLQAIVVNEKGMVKAFISYEDDDSNPIICNLYEENAQIEEYSSFEISREFVDTFRSMFLKCNLKVNKSHNFQILEEDAFENIELRYVITESYM